MMWKISAYRITTTRALPNPSWAVDYTMLIPIRRQLYSGVACIMSFAIGCHVHFNNALFLWGIVMSLAAACCFWERISNHEAIKVTYQPMHVMLNQEGEAVTAHSIVPQSRTSLVSSLLSVSVLTALFRHLSTPSRYLPSNMTLSPHLLSSTIYEEISGAHPSCKSSSGTRSRLQCHPCVGKPTQHHRSDQPSL